FARESARRCGRCFRRRRCAAGGQGQRADDHPEPLTARAVHAPILCRVSPQLASGAQSKLAIVMPARQSSTHPTGTYVHSVGTPCSSPPRRSVYAAGSCAKSDAHSARSCSTVDAGKMLHDVPCEPTSADRSSQTVIHEPTSRPPSAVWVE